MKLARNENRNSEILSHALKGVFDQRKAKRFYNRMVAQVRRREDFRNGVHTARERNSTRRIIFRTLFLDTHRRPYIER